MSASPIVRVESFERSRLRTGDFRSGNSNGSRGVSHFLLESIGGSNACSGDLRLEDRRGRHALRFALGWSDSRKKLRALKFFIGLGLQIA